MVKWKSENREKRNEMLYWIYEWKIIIYFRQFKKQKKKLKIKENVLRGFQAINKWFSYRSSRVICTRQSRKHRSRSLQMNGRCAIVKRELKKKDKSRNKEECVWTRAWATSLCATNDRELIFTEKMSHDLPMCLTVGV